MKIQKLKITSTVLEEEDVTTALMSDLTAGLTSDEIQLAVQRSGVTDDVSSSQTAQPPQPVPQHPGAYGQSALVPVQPMLPRKLAEKFSCDIV